MTLSDYMAHEGLDDLAMATILGIDRSSVYRLRMRQTRPSWPVIQRILEATRGRVRPDDFLYADAPPAFAGRRSVCAPSTT